MYESDHLCGCYSRAQFLGNLCEVWFDWSPQQQSPQLSPETLGMDGTPHFPLISFTCVYWGMRMRMGLGCGWPVTWPVSYHYFLLSQLYPSPGEAQKRRKECMMNFCKQCPRYVGIYSLFSVFWKLMLDKGISFDDKFLWFSYGKKNSWTCYWSTVTPIYLMFTYLENGSTSVCQIFFFLNAIFIMALKAWLF